MENAISVQTFEFINAAVLGVFLGIFYDILKTVRSYTKNGKGITNLFDAVFWAVAVISLFVFVLVSADGRMRWYILVGTFCGAFIYRAFAGVIVFKVLRGTVDILTDILRMCSQPIYLFLRKIRKFFTKAERKIRQKTFSHKKKRKRKADELGSKKKKK